MIINVDQLGLLLACSDALPILIHTTSPCFAKRLAYFAIVVLAGQEGYSCQGKLFNPFSPEDRNEHRELFLWFDIDTGKAWCEPEKVRSALLVVVLGARLR